MFRSNILPLTSGDKMDADGLSDNFAPVSLGNGSSVTAQVQPQGC